MCAEKSDGVRLEREFIRPGGLPAELSKRMAIIRVDGELLAGVVSRLRDVDVVVVGSLASSFIPMRGTDQSSDVHLILRGEALPAECEFGTKLITMTFVQETYGEQRITKIEKFEIAGEWESPFGKAA